MFFYDNRLCGGSKFKGKKVIYSERSPLCTSRLTTEWSATVADFSEIRRVSSAGLIGPARLNALSHLDDPLAWD